MEQHSLGSAKETRSVINKLPSEAKTAGVIKTWPFEFDPESLFRDLQEKRSSFTLDDVW